MGPRGRRPGGLCLSVQGKGSGGGIRGGVRARVWGGRRRRRPARPGAPGGRSAGTSGCGLRAHLTRNCSFHTFPLLWQSSRSRRQVLETRLMSVAVSEPQHRMYSSTSPGKLTRQLRPAASGTASSGSACTTSIGLSTAAAILSEYLGPRHARACALGETPFRPAHLPASRGGAKARHAHACGHTPCARASGGGRSAAAPQRERNAFLENNWAVGLGAVNQRIIMPVFPIRASSNVSCELFSPSFSWGNRFREINKSPLSYLDSNPDLLDFCLTASKGGCNHHKRDILAWILCQALYLWFSHP